MLLLYNFHLFLARQPFCEADSIAQTVPDSKSRSIPEVVIVRRGQLGFWEFGKGGTVG